MKRVIKASLKIPKAQDTQQPSRDNLKCTFTLTEFLEIAKAIKNGESFECFFEPTLDECGDVTIGENPSLDEYYSQEEM